MYDDCKAVSVSDSGKYLVLRTTFKGGENVSGNVGSIGKEKKDLAVIESGSAKWVLSSKEIGYPIAWSDQERYVLCQNGSERFSLVDLEDGKVLILAKEMNGFLKLLEQVATIRLSRDGGIVFMTSKVDGLSFKPLKIR